MTPGPWSPLTSVEVARRFEHQPIQARRTAAFGRFGEAVESHQSINIYECMAADWLGIGVPRHDGLLIGPGWEVRAMVPREPSPVQWLACLMPGEIAACEVQP